MPKKRKSRAKGPLPKGAYRVPGGGYVLNKRTVISTGKDRQISVIGVRREQPDLERLAKAIIADAIAQARRDIEAESKDNQCPAA